MAGCCHDPGCNDLNGGVAVMLYRFRRGDANMRSVRICSRNDAIGNVAVPCAAAGVFGTGTGRPDVIVASIMAALALTGGAQIIRQSQAKLRGRAQMQESVTTWRESGKSPADGKAAWLRHEA
jgi:Co/Zn/Cd efflux system component